MAQLGEQGTIKKLIFSVAKRAGAVRIKGLRVDLAARNHPLAKLSDLLVGRKLRNKIGLDRCRILITGAAPFRSDLMRFFASFGLSIREVYGLTENFTFGTLNLAHDINIGSCGVAFPYNEMRIANDGEIMFRAPWMFKQYYKDPQATSEALSREGWFATGDLGEVDSEGRLKIVGRKKELIKTSGGKFIAPVPIENLFKDLPLIKDVVVVGDQHKYCVALVSLEDNLALSPEEIRLKLSDYLQSINASLASFESIKRIGVLNDAMSVANGLLTPTLKVRRGNLKEKKAAFIESVYNTQDKVIFEQIAE
jgi:long-chain acyl-CoA synthetase